MKIGKPVSTTAIALGLAAIAGTAGAQEVTGDGAAAIERGLKQWLVDNLTFPEDTATLTFDGAIEAEPMGDRYRLTIPSPIVSDAFGTVLADIGVITADLTPQGEHRFLVSWTLPDEIMLGPPDEELVVLTIAEQVGEGLFDARYGTFLDVEMDWSGLSLRPASDEGSLEIGSISVVSVSEERDGEIYDFDVEAAVLDVTFADNWSGDAVSIAEIGLLGRMEQVDLPAYMAFSLAVNDLVTEIEAAESAGGDPTAIVERMASLIEEAPVLFDTMDMTYLLTDARFDVDQEAVAIEGGELAVGVSGLSSGAGTITLGFSQGSMEIDPPPPFAEAIPDSIAVDLAVTDLPNEAIVANVVAAIRDMLASGPEAAMMARLFPLQQAALEAGSRFSVEQFEVVSPHYEVAFDGYVAPSATSPFSAVGEAQLLIGQFAALRALVERLAPDPDMLAGLAVFEAAGQQVEGRDARRYTFEATEDGRFLLNGGDMGPLVEQMMR